MEIALPVNLKLKLLLLILCSCNFVLSQLISDLLRKQQERIPSGTLIHSQIHSNQNGAAKQEGELVNLHDKLIQRITSTGSSYYLIENGNGKPLYRRHEIDTNRDFVVFPDPNYKSGDGHYVVLRRLFTHNTLTPYREPVYQGFYLVFSDSVHAFMRKWEPATTTENPKMKKLEEQELQRKRQSTYTVEYGEAVDFGDFVRQQ